MPCKILLPNRCQALYCYGPDNSLMMNRFVVFLNEANRRGNGGSWARRCGFGEDGRLARTRRLPGKVSGNGF
jgi:hypothetical protein